MKQISIKPAILGIGTAVPVYRLEQREVASRLAEALQDYPDSARWARRIFHQCGVVNRFTCEPNLLEPPEQCRYLIRESLDEVPSTEERMQLYKKESVPLALEAAGQALADSGTKSAEITHLLTVSCTGQFLPGLDSALIDQLGLERDIVRYPFQFQGCAAGLKAICMAKDLVSASPQAKVLIVCVELCTLHIQPSARREDLFGASFFGDGSSACVVAVPGIKQPQEQAVFTLGDYRSVLLPDTAEEMVWEIGNHGFNLYLSPHIPKHISQYIPAEVERLLGADHLPELWAIHPGGRGIVDAVQAMYGLTDEQVSPSRTVLSNFGNLSSATLLFVLRELRERLAADQSAEAEGVALAFGPGLTAELLRISYIPSGAQVMPKPDQLYV
ncbi:type III polyketide synthase [Paenibacillus sp. FJAT-26967]|uniref:type III polyketide synthase n=1 Tax=Paenibacillus sp. FJAT-26967 TaxID=1729690 RepID=UPI0008395C66|nr:type III polyketide synthase [Paenibacillus sp. FJAT-26967]